MSNAGNKQYSLVTGASSGIGKAIAFECADRGRNVILVALPNENLGETAEEIINRFNVDARFFEADLSNNDTPRKIFDWCTDQGLTVNMLVNNAGLGGVGAFENTSADNIRYMIDLNIKAVAVLTNLFLPQLIEGNPGYLLNTSSMAGLQPIPYKSVYASTKAFVYSLSRALHEELKGRVHVSALCPGAVPTNDDVKARIAAQGFGGRVSSVTPEVVARVALNGLLRNKPLIIPGGVNKFFYWLSKLPLGSFQQRSMTKRFKSREI